MKRHTIELTTLNFSAVLKARLASVLAVVLVYGAAVAPVAEANFWADRRKAADGVNGSSPADASSSNNTNPLYAAFGNANPMLMDDASLQAYSAQAQNLISKGLSDLPITPRTTDQKPLLDWMRTLVTSQGEIEDFYLTEGMKKIHKWSFADKKSEPLVVLMQDVHNVTEAQSNMAKILEAYQTRAGLDMVGLEGAVGGFVIKKFRDVKAPEALRWATDFLLKEKMISGAEHFGFNAPRLPELWGVEDGETYQANVEAYKATVQHRPAVAAFEGALAQNLAVLQKAVNSPALQEFERLRSAHHDDKIGLGDYVTTLAEGSAKSAGVNTAAFPNITLFRKAVAMEKALDFTKVESERTEFLKNLTGSLTAADMTRLVALSLEFRLHHVSFGDYYQLLKSMASRHGVSLKGYPTLEKYVSYALLSDGIARASFLDEITIFEESIGTGLAKTPAQKELLSLTRDAALIKKIVHHNLTYREWSLYGVRGAAVAQWPQRLRALAEKTGVSASAPSDFGFPLDLFESFYKDAEARNEHFVKHLFAKMKESGQRSAVLVAGGFHTEGVRSLLKKRGISHVVVTPSLTTFDKDDNYLDVFVRAHTPLEKLMLGEKLFIRAPLGTAEEGGISGSGIVRSLAPFLLVGALVLGSLAMTRESAQKSMEQSGLPVKIGAVSVNNGVAQVPLSYGKTNVVFVASPQGKEPAKGIPLGKLYNEQTASLMPGEVSKSSGISTKAKALFGALMAALSLPAFPIRSRKALAPKILAFAGWGEQMSNLATDLTSREWGLALFGAVGWVILFFVALRAFIVGRSRARSLAAGVGQTVSPNQVLADRLKEAGWNASIDLGILSSLADIEIMPLLKNEIRMKNRRTGRILAINKLAGIEEAGYLDKKLNKRKVESLRVGSYAYEIRADVPIRLDRDWLGNDQLLVWAGVTPAAMAAKVHALGGRSERTKYIHDLIGDIPRPDTPQAPAPPTEVALRQARLSLATSSYDQLPPSERLLYLHHIAVLNRRRVTEMDMPYEDVLADRLLASTKLREAATREIDPAMAHAIEDLMWSAGFQVVRSPADESRDRPPLSAEERRRLEKGEVFEVNSLEDAERLYTVAEEAMKSGRLRPYFIINIKNFSPDTYLAYLKALEGVSAQYGGKLTFLVSVEQPGTLTTDFCGPHTAMRKVGDALGRSFFEFEHFAMVSDGGSKTRGGPPTNAHHGQFSLKNLLRLRRTGENPEAQVIPFLDFNVVTTAAAWLQMKGNYGRRVFIWPASDGIIEFGAHPRFGKHPLTELPARFMSVSGPFLRLFPPEVIQKMREASAQVGGTGLPVRELLEEDDRVLSGFIAERLVFKVESGELLERDRGTLTAMVAKRLGKTSTGEVVEKEVQRVQSAQQRVVRDLASVKEKGRQFREKFKSELSAANRIFQEYLLYDKGNFTSDDKESGEELKFIEKPRFSVLVDKMVAAGRGNLGMNLFFLMGDKATIWDLLVAKFAEIINPRTGVRIGQEVIDDKGNGTSIFTNVFQGVTERNMEDPRSQAAIAYARENGVAILGFNYGEDSQAGDIGNLGVNANMYRNVIQNPRLQYPQRRNPGSVRLPSNVDLYYKRTDGVERRLGAELADAKFLLMNLLVTAPAEGRYKIVVSEGSGLISGVIRFNADFRELVLTPDSVLMDFEISAPVKFHGSGATVETFRRTPEFGSNYDFTEAKVGHRNVMSRETGPVPTKAPVNIFGGETTVTIPIHIGEGLVRTFVVRAWNMDYKKPIRQILEERIHAKRASDGLRRGKPITEEELEKTFVELAREHPYILDIVGLSNFDQMTAKTSLYDLPTFGGMTFEQALGYVGKGLSFEEAKGKIAALEQREWIAYVRNAWREAPVPAAEPETPPSSARWEAVSTPSNDVSLEEHLRRLEVGQRLLKERKSSLVQTSDLRGKTGDFNGKTDDGQDPFLVPETAYALGVGLGKDIHSLYSELSAVLFQSEKPVVQVNGDNRWTTPALRKAFVEGLTAMGCDVRYSEEPVSTPASDIVSRDNERQPHAVVQITAGHNPAEGPESENGFKISYRSSDGQLHAISKRDLNTVLEKAVGREALTPVPQDQRGEATEQKILEAYADKVEAQLAALLKDRKLMEDPSSNPLKDVVIAFDAGQGVMGKVAPVVLAKLKIPFVSVTNHSKETFDAVRRENKGKSVFMIVLEGDGGRVRILDEEGNELNPTQTAYMIYKMHPQGNHLFDIRSGNEIFELTGVQPKEGNVHSPGWASVAHALQARGAPVGYESSTLYFTDVEGNIVADGLLGALDFLTYSLTLQQRQGQGKSSLAEEIRRAGESREKEGKPAWYPEMQEFRPKVSEGPGQSRFVLLPQIIEDVTFLLHQQFPNLKIVLIRSPGEQWEMKDKAGHIKKVGGIRLQIMDTKGAFIGSMVLRCSLTEPRLSFLAKGRDAKILNELQAILRQALSKPELRNFVDQNAVEIALAPSAEAPAVRPALRESLIQGIAAASIVSPEKVRGYLKGQGGLSKGEESYVEAHLNIVLLEIIEGILRAPGLHIDAGVERAAQAILDEINSTRDTKTPSLLPAALRLANHTKNPGWAEVGRALLIELQEEQTGPSTLAPSAAAEILETIPATLTPAERGVISFPTAGWRGHFPINEHPEGIFTTAHIQLLAYGLAQHLLERWQKGELPKKMMDGDGRPIVVIGYDHRQPDPDAPMLSSKAYAEEEARILAAYGIKVILHDIQDPSKNGTATPLNMFALRYFNGAVMINNTGSHNPGYDGGIEFFDGKTGGLANEDLTNPIVAHVKSAKSILRAAGNNGLIRRVQPPVKEYAEYVKNEVGIDMDLIKKSGVRMYFDAQRGLGGWFKDVLDVLGVKTAVEGQPGEEEAQVVFRNVVSHPFFGAETDLEKKTRNSEVTEKNLNPLIEFMKDKQGAIAGAVDGDCDRGMGVTPQGYRDGTDWAAMFLFFELSKLKKKAGKNWENEKNKYVAVRSFVSSIWVDGVLDYFGIPVEQNLRLSGVGYRKLNRVAGILKNEGKEPVLLFEENGGFAFHNGILYKDGFAANLLILELAAALKSDGLPELDWSKIGKSPSERNKTVDEFYRLIGQLVPRPDFKRSDQPLANMVATEFKAQNKESEGGNKAVVLRVASPLGGTNGAIVRHFRSEMNKLDNAKRQSGSAFLEIGPSLKLAVKSTMRDKARAEIFGKGKGKRDLHELDRADRQIFYVQFQDGSWISLRASGTEPILRVYVEAPDKARQEQITAWAQGIIDGFVSQAVKDAPLPTAGGGMGGKILLAALATGISGAALAADASAAVSSGFWGDVSILLFLVGGVGLMLLSKIRGWGSSSFLIPLALFFTLTLGFIPDANAIGFGLGLAGTLSLWRWFAEILGLGGLGLISRFGGGTSPVPDRDTELRVAKGVTAKLTGSVLASKDPGMLKRFLQGGYKQDGYGVEAGAVVNGSFARGDNAGNQGYFAKGGKDAYIRVYEGMKSFFDRRAKRNGRPIRLIIKPGIGGQHTPFQGHATVFEVIDAVTGKIVGEYELGKDYGAYLEGLKTKMGIEWDQIAVIPSSKSGSTDEMMMVFLELLAVLLEKQSAKGFADVFLNTLHEVNFIDAKERPGKDLFKVDSERFGTESLISLLAKRAAAAGVSISEPEVRQVLGNVLGNMFFETTDRVDESRLSAFVQNSKLDKEFGSDAPGFGAMFDNVGGRWTADLHMLAFLAYHKLDAEKYWKARDAGIARVMAGNHIANGIANRIVDQRVERIALVVDDEFFWYGKSIEQNFNESLWPADPAGEERTANLVAVRASDWEVQRHHYLGDPRALVINISGKEIDGQVKIDASFDAAAGRQALAQTFAELATTFYGVTSMVGDRLIARALIRGGFTDEDVDMSNLDNPATRILQEHLYVRQPFVELGKGLLEERLKVLQTAEAKEKGAIERAYGDIVQEARDQKAQTNISGFSGLKGAKGAGAYENMIRQAVLHAEKEGRRPLFFLYAQGAEFIAMRDALIKMGYPWVLQGTGDQHISYQQVLAQPRYYLPIFVSMVSELPQKGRPATGFAKGYLDNVSPDLVRHYFAEASYGALTEKRKEQGGQGLFLTLLDTKGNREMLLAAAQAAAKGTSIEPLAGVQTAMLESLAALLPVVQGLTERLKPTRVIEENPAERARRQFNLLKLASLLDGQLSQGLTDADQVLQLFYRLHRDGVEVDFLNQKEIRDLIASFNTLAQKDKGAAQRGFFTYALASLFEIQLWAPLAGLEVRDLAAFLLWQHGRLFGTENRAEVANVLYSLAEKARESIETKRPPFIRSLRGRSTFFPEFPADHAQVNLIPIPKDVFDPDKAEAALETVWKEIVVGLNHQQDIAFLLPVEGGKGVENKIWAMINQRGKEYVRAKTDPTEAEQRINTLASKAASGKIFLPAEPNLLAEGKFQVDKVYVAVGAALGYPLKSYRLSITSADFIADWDLTSVPEDMRNLVSFILLAAGDVIRILPMTDRDLQVLKILSQNA